MSVAALQLNSYKSIGLHGILTSFFTCGSCLVLQRVSGMQLWVRIKKCFIQGRGSERQLWEQSGCVGNMSSMSSRGPRSCCSCRGRQRVMWAWSRQSLWEKLCLAVRANDLWSFFLAMGQTLWRTMVGHVHVCNGRKIASAQTTTWTCVWLLTPLLLLWPQKPHQMIWGEALWRFKFGCYILNVCLFVWRYKLPCGHCLDVHRTSGWPGLAKYSKKKKPWWKEIVRGHFFLSHQAAVL